MDKIYEGKMTYWLYQALVEGRWSDYDYYGKGLTPAVAKLVAVYCDHFGWTPDADDQHWGLSEEEAILEHAETGALMIVGGTKDTGDFYVAQWLTGEIHIDHKRLPEQAHLADLEKIADLDATLEEQGAQRIVMHGACSHGALEELIRLPWVVDVRVLKPS